MNAIFTDASFQNMNNIASRYGISIGAVTDLTQTLMRSNGTMAQFNIFELGGGGQWMQGGMTMVGDMFNNQLKATVDGLCIEISNLIHQGGIQYKPLPKIQNQGQGGFQSGFSGNWWGDLGFPNSTGSQNNTSYAIFSNIRRLAIQQNGKVTVFDTLDNNIGGVGQQQGGTYSVNFTSQYGTVDLSSLPIVSGAENKPKPQETANNLNANVQNQPAPIVAESAQPIQNTMNNLEEDIFAKIEKLAALKNKEIISFEDFENKKAELLGRL
ncbi:MULTISPECIES: SHOCT domain-containing protein [unclassified Polaribacter]|uniref:SHOCT domain-containing protein n=1 Tax=unclassified Polaribacter TaxID=196858 RepID=UPI0011BDCF8E|nr:MULTISPECIES: SHOCT domain-containing protein [unclassified Polaribacter]TXD52969.1 SHOCT domain-containing protein [Polaribacter sp. IC063]TXD60939.1 SHOCT domain-containing protein [Polaribacter sp. IC066]